MLAVTHPAGHAVHDHSNSALCQCRLLGSPLRQNSVRKRFRNRFRYYTIGRGESTTRRSLRAVSASSRPVLLSDVAAAAGVSLATVSRALNSQAGVDAELAEKVRNVAQDLGYVANLHARQLAGGATSVIGLIVHEID